MEAWTKGHATVKGCLSKEEIFDISLIGTTRDWLPLPNPGKKKRQNQESEIPASRGIRFEG